jgi:hypothetical protein
MNQQVSGYEDLYGAEDSVRSIPSQKSYLCHPERLSPDARKKPIGLVSGAKVKNASMKTAKGLNVIVDIYRSARLEVLTKLLGRGALQYIWDPQKPHNFLFSKGTAFYLFNPLVARTLVREILLAVPHAGSRFWRVLNSPLLRMGASQWGGLGLKDLQRILPNPEETERYMQDIEKLLYRLDGPVERDIAVRAYCLGIKKGFRIADSKASDSSQVP